MFHQIASWLAPHGINDDINALTTRQFRRRDKISIACNKNDLVNLPLVGERGHIKA